MVRLLAEGRIIASQIELSEQVCRQEVEPGRLYLVLFLIQFFAKFLVPVTVREKATVLQKPYGSQYLAQKLREKLDKKKNK